MGIIRSGLAFVVVIVLTLSLVTGNVVTAVDRTALNEEFVTTTLEEEEAYRTGQSIIADRVEKEISDVDLPVSIQDLVDPRRAVKEVLTRAYLKNQTEANINRAFQFLNGETEEFELWVDVTPVKNNTANLAEERIRELTLAEMIEAIPAAEEFSVEVLGIRLDLQMVANMSKGPESYNQTKEAFRSDVRQALINRTYQETSIDNRLLLINKDPNQYNESEKKQIVEENEEEIKEKIGDRITEERVQEQLNKLNDEIEPLAEQGINGTLPETLDPVKKPLTDLVILAAEGLTTDMEYETFDAELSRIKANLADNISIVVREAFEEQLPSRVSLTEDLSPSAEERLDQAQQAVGIIGLLSVLLPIVALVLIGLLYLITRSLASTAFGAGVALLSSGGGGFIVGTITPGMVESQVQSELTGEQVPQRAIDVAIGIVEQIFGALAAQSLALAVLGIALVIAGLYLRFRGGESSGEPADSGAAAE